MKLVATAFLWIAACIAVPGAANAADSDSWAVYQKLVAKCETAKSIDELLPFLPEWKRGRIAASDEAGRAESLARICGATKDLAGMAFVSEETTGAGTVLNLTATWNDFPMKGKVTVVREEGALKVEEWVWATSK